MKIDELNLQIVYNFQSSFIGEEYIDTLAFFQDYMANVYEGEALASIHNKYVGQVEFKIMDVAKAELYGEKIHDVFDTYETTYRWGQTFYDLVEEQFHPALLKAYPDLELFTERICFIEKIALLPAYRGKQIGNQIWNNILWNFGTQCSLFVVYAFPLQFDLSLKEKEEVQKLALTELDTDEEKAKDKLKAFYTRLGFKEFKEIEDMFFYCPLYK